MRYYRELDIDFSEIKQAVLQDFDPKTMSRFWNEVDQKHLNILKRMFAPLNITPKKYSLIHATPQTFNIHADAVEENVRINIPILNCEYSSTFFYRVKSDKAHKALVNPKYIMTHNKRAHVSFSQSDVELVDAVKLTKPTLMRIREPHAVGVKKGHHPRVSLTVLFEENLESMIDAVL